MSDDQSPADYPDLQSFLDSALTPGSALTGVPQVVPPPAPQPTAPETEVDWRTLALAVVLAFASGWLAHAYFGSRPQTCTPFECPPNRELYRDQPASTPFRTTPPTWGDAMGDAGHSRPGSFRWSDPRLLADVPDVWPVPDPAGS